ELPRPSYPIKMLYLFLMSVIPTIPASFLTFGDTVLYKFYAHAPRVFGVSAISDQQIAGALMKVYAGSILWAAIVLLFYKWYATEQQGKPSLAPPPPPTPPPSSPEGADLPEVLTWDDVERELNRGHQVT